MRKLDAQRLAVSLMDEQPSATVEVLRPPDAAPEPYGWAVSVNDGRPHALVRTLRQAQERAHMCNTLPLDVLTPALERYARSHLSLLTVLQNAESRYADPTLRALFAEVVEDGMLHHGYNLDRAISTAHAYVMAFSPPDHVPDWHMPE